MDPLRWRLREWSIRLLVVAPVAAAALALGDLGAWLVEGIVAVLFGVLGWLGSAGKPLWQRVLATWCLSFYAFAWPAAFHAVAEPSLPEPGVGRLLIQLTTIAPAIVGIAALTARRHAVWRRASPVVWAFFVLGLALLLPFPWLETPWRFVVPGIGIAFVLLGAALAPRPT